MIHTRRLEMQNQPACFDFAAEVGLTKHIGGVEATEALIEEVCQAGNIADNRQRYFGYGLLVGQK